MNNSIILVELTGDSSNFTVTYEHIASGGTGQFQFVQNTNQYSVFGTSHTGETVEEDVTIEASEEVTPEQVFWLIAQVLEAVFCPECGDKTDPE